MGRVTVVSSYDIGCASSSSRREGNLTTGCSKSSGHERAWAACEGSGRAGVGEGNGARWSDLSSRVSRRIVDGGSTRCGLAGRDAGWRAGDARVCGPSVDDDACGATAQGVSRVTGIVGRDTCSAGGRRGKCGSACGRSCRSCQRACCESTTNPGLAESNCSSWSDECAWRIVSDSHVAC